MQALQLWAARNLPGGGHAIEPPEKPQHPAPPVQSPRQLNPTAVNVSTPPTPTKIQYNLVQLEPPRPLSAINDDPVVDEHDAAVILGLKAETLKKWRQRKQGPEYLQYGRAG